MSVCTEAEELINGQRRADYGPVEEGFKKLAALWSATLGVEVNAKQVCACMIQLKISRLIVGWTHDSIVDICGYAACLEQIIAAESAAEAAAGYAACFEQIIAAEERGKATSDDDIAVVPVSEYNRIGIDTLSTTSEHFGVHRPLPSGSCDFIPVCGFTDGGTIDPTAKSWPHWCHECQGPCKITLQETDI